MVSRTPVALTQTGFRRDVRLFLSALVGFFAALILFLLVLLQIATSRAETAMWQHWNEVADQAASELDRNVDSAASETTLAFVQAKYGIAGMELVLPTGRRIRTAAGSGGLDGQIVRRTRAGQVRFFFEAPDVQNVRRMFRATAAIVIAATAGGLLLLALYLPRITRPIEEMLESAKALGERGAGVDEDRYLIDTFRGSIATLQAQEVELKRLHEREKNRADDLERITATLTRSLASGFLAVDPQEAIVDINHAARQILQLPADRSYYGAPLATAFARPRFTELITEAFRKRESLSRVEIAEGDQTIGLTTVPLQRDSGEFLGLLALFTDLTPIRTLESRVSQLQALADLGEMSAGIAHEFRNSLATILGYLRLAQRQSEFSGAIERIQKAEEEASSLSAAGDALLNFSRPMQMQRTRFDLMHSIEEVARRIADTRSIELTIDGSRFPVDGDMALLQRVFENIIRNSLDAIRERGGEGWIRIKADASEGVISVEDNGAGVGSEDASKAFVPFHSTKSDGFGLGLPLARKIVLLHGGAIALESTPGEGTKVKVELPVVA